MPNVYSDVLMEVAGETLEQLAFIFSFPDEMEPDAIWAESVIGCHVTFNGQAQGGLLMLISAAALPELAANMLGLDESANEKTVKERANEFAKIVDELITNKRRFEQLTMKKEK